MLVRPYAICCVAASLALAGCGDAGRSGKDFYALDRSGRYGGFAQWAHQFMGAEEAKARMEREGFACELPRGYSSWKNEKDRRTRRGEFMTCRYHGFDPWFGSKRVAFGLSYPDGHLTSAHGYRFYFTFFDSSVTGSELDASGVVFANASEAADFIVHHVGVANPCRVDPGAAGCVSTSARDYEATCLKSPQTPGCSDHPVRRLLLPTKHWDGREIDAGTPEYLMESLEKTGVDCGGFARARHGDKLQAVLEEDVAWVRCGMTSFDGHKQAAMIGIDMDTGALVRIRAVAGDETVEIPVKRRLPKLAEEGREELMIIADKQGTPLMVRMSNVGLALDSSVLQTLPATDHWTRQRLFKGAIRRVEASYKAMDDPFTPLLQRIEFGSHLLRRFARGALDTAEQSSLQLGTGAMASLAVADCGERELAEARACFKRYIARNPAIDGLFREALSEASRYARPLPQGHVVRARIERLASATRD